VFGVEAFTSAAGPNQETSSKHLFLHRRY